jgi:steroid delta-isomerase-like uncharacterized protein
MTLKTHPIARDIAKEYTDQVWNKKDLSVIVRLVDKEILIHSLLGNFRGIEAMTEVVQAWLKAFPDLKVSIELIISENDLVSVQWNAKGTHHRDFKGKKPTGKSVSYNGATVYRVNNGKIVEYWAYLDMQHLLDQL